MNLVLVGMPCSGKSSVAKLLWASLRNMYYKDIDDRISDWEGHSVKAIIERRGEEYFRKEEALLIANMCRFEENWIISTGGGSLIKEENLTNLQRRGILFYLKTSPEEIYRRGILDTSRPLLPESLEGITNLLEERESQYLKADVHIETEGRLIKDIVEEVRVKYLMIQELMK